MVVIELRLRGLLCMENCGARVQAALAAVPGVKAVRIDPDFKVARIDASPNVQVIFDNRRMSDDCSSLAFMLGLVAIILYSYNAHRVLQKKPTYSLATPVSLFIFIL